MFLKYRPVNRHLPSLLSGFHGVDSPPLYQHYEDAKTAFALLLAFVSFGSDTFRYRLFLAHRQGGDIYPVCQDCFGSVNLVYTEFR